MRGLVRVPAALVALVGSATVAGSSRPDEPGRFVEVWVRGATSDQDVAPGHVRARRVDLDDAGSTKAERYDAQYERVARYRGVPLRALLGSFEGDQPLDLAILHFANGMAVPLAFRDRTTMARLEPFVARAYAPNVKEPLGGAFPPVRKEGSVPDPRPTQFSGNKLVVADRWHPDVASATATVFSPWARVDTLVSVELVSAARYYAQFDVSPEPLVQRGLALFRANCQFCHGARHVGASFGWDFVDAPSVYDAQSSAANLYHHIAYRPRNATELGLLMPALATLTEEDAASLQRWLQAIATRPMPAYEPPARYRAHRGD
jgi:mono/diheme cytochrome c family protein